MIYWHLYFFSVAPSLDIDVSLIIYAQDDGWNSSYPKLVDYICSRYDLVSLCRYSRMRQATGGTESDFSFGHSTIKVHICLKSSGSTTYSRFAAVKHQSDHLGKRLNHQQWIWLQGYRVPFQPSLRIYHWRMRLKWNPRRPYRSETYRSAPRVPDSTSWFSLETFRVLHFSSCCNFHGGKLPVYDRLHNFKN